MKIILIAAVMLLATSLVNANALSNCVFPSADEDNADDSSPNIEGRLVEVTPSLLVIAEKGEKKEVKVELANDVSYSTAFGGFVRPQDLLPGQYIWIWYEECGSSNAEVQKAKIVKLYSLDPNDRP